MRLSVTVSAVHNSSAATYNIGMVLNLPPQNLAAVEVGHYLVLNHGHVDNSLDVRKWASLGPLDAAYADGEN